MGRTFNAAAVGDGRVLLLSHVVPPYSVLGSTKV
jgi:hypothetical protein